MSDNNTRARASKSGPRAAQDETHPVSKHKATVAQLSSELPLPPMKAICKKCLDCSARNRKEVRLCAVTDCPPYAYRMGTNPYHRNRADEEMGLISKNRWKNEGVLEEKVKTGIQGRNSRRSTDEGVKSVSVAESVELLRQKQDVALEECEAETSFGEADLQRTERLLATWALRRGPPYAEALGFNDDGGTTGSRRETQTLGWCIERGG